MSFQFKSKEFKDLQSKWYSKLKKSGFDDIEVGEKRLRFVGSSWHSEYRRYNKDKIEAKENYYRLAGQFTYDNVFKDELEKHIWRLHAEGFSIREIAKILKKKTYKAFVHETLQALEKKMINKATGKTK